MVLKKLNTELLYDQAIPLLGIHRKELKAGTQIHMFKAALFTTARRWKPLKCLLMNKWITKCGMHIHWNIIQP